MGGVGGIGEGREIAGVGGRGEGREGAGAGWDLDVSDCPLISASASRGGGEWTRGGTRGGGGGEDGGVELRDELGALPILTFACSTGGCILGGGGGGGEGIKGLGC